MKSKIEEKIKNAREATNEMFAAFEELNEKLSNPVICEIRGPISRDIVIRDKMEEQRKWSPKDGEYYAAKKSGSLIWIGIKRGKDIYFDGQDIPDYCHICSGEEGTLNIYNSELVFVKSVRPATPSEIALLDSKLAEQGKRFDKEKLELVDIPKFKVGDWFIPHKPKENKTATNWAVEMDKFDGVALQVSIPKYKYTENIYSEVADWHFHPDWCEKTTAPKHKEPIIGEMAIFWNFNKCNAHIRIFTDKREGRYIEHIGCSWNNAILYESPEQYKAFLKS